MRYYNCTILQGDGRPKVGFATKAEADQRLKEIQAATARDGLKGRPYAPIRSYGDCAGCSNWHLTHTPARAAGLPTRSPVELARIARMNGR